MMHNNNRPKSDFEHEVDFARKIISIEDLDMGKMSVTNNIENIVDYISKADNIDPTQYMIVYRDSEGRWDGWDHGKHQFIHLGASTCDEAVEKYHGKMVKDEHKYIVNITVSGPAGSGKTNIAIFLKQKLEEIGLDVADIEDEDITPKMAANRDFSHLKYKPRKIMIKTVQTKRDHPQTAGSEVVSTNE